MRNVNRGFVLVPVVSHCVIEKGWMVIYVKHLSENAVLVVSGDSMTAEWVNLGW